MADLRPRAVRIDVGELVQRSVASLYSHLVTRPTGRAVRLAIETQLAEAGDIAFSMIDLSEVTLLDFSCADEVVAKLLLRYLDVDRPREAFFVFRGVRELHRHPMEVVLHRQELATVAQRADGVYELLGELTPTETGVWAVIEDRGWIRAHEIDGLWASEPERRALERLAARRLVFRAPTSRDLYALSRLAQDLSA